MPRWHRFGGCVWLAAALAATAWRPQDPPVAPPRSLGAKVTFERLGPADAPRLEHSQRARLLSLAVERGETPTPFLPPGMFRATWRTTLVLPARDRAHFRAEGRGDVELRVNGETVLAGAMRPGRPVATAQMARLKKGDNELVLVFGSGAMGDGQLRLSWSTADFGFEPIAPERLSFPDDAGLAAGELRRSGMQLFAERRCARCHEPEVRRVGESAFGELDVTGPDLRTVGGRVRTEWIAAWLRAPRQFRADATMPRFPLSDAECADLAAWLHGGAAPAPPPAFPADAAARGKERFRELGCIACHAAPEEGAGGQALGDRIALGFVPQKWHAQALVEYVQNPRVAHEHVRMPDLAVGLADAVAIAAYLLASPPAPLPPVAGDPANGRRLAQRHGCAHCHAVDLPPAEPRYARLRNLHPERGCLAEQPAAAGAPDHGLTAEQRAALRAFLPFAEEAPFRNSPLDFAQRHLTAARCTACHALDGQPSVWARWAEREGAAAPLPREQDPVAQGVPALTWTGSKLQPSWIQRFVTGAEPSPRPWLVARMPAFHRFGVPIAQGLVREHGYGPQDEPPVAADARLAMHGERLLGQGSGFGCVQCHAVGDRPAVQVFEREGIELTRAVGRLRHEYYTRWLADPPRLDPDARMPRYADAKGRTAFTEVLGGDAAQQFEAIWQHLSGLRASRR